MIRIDVDVNYSQALRRLAQIKARAQNVTPVLRWARSRMERANAANFAANGVPSGGAWDPLSPKYGAWKSANFPGRPTLQRNGKLFRSLTNMKGAPSYIKPVDAQFGTSVKYAKFHQTGTRFMPKRQIVFEPAGFSFALAERTASYVANGRF
jgi:phage gpG-like protein